MGMSDEVLARCRRVLDQIGVMEEARIASACPGTRALHDVTEGGVATALSELSTAGGYTFNLWLKTDDVATNGTGTLLGVRDAAASFSEIFFEKRDGRWWFAGGSAAEIRFLTA